MKIYVDKLPKSCGDCDFVHEEVIDTFENMEKLLHHTCTLLNGIGIYTHERHIDCPLIELKQKELKWESLNVSGLCSALNNKYTISTNRIHENQSIYYSYYFLGIHLDNVDSLNDAMKRCQEHCNNLFHEMIGE